MPATSTQPIEISIEEIGARKDVTIIDCRSVEEYEEGHLPNSLNIPLQHLSVLVDDFPCNFDDQFYVYCKTGNRSGTFAMYLRTIGYAKCQSISGGYELWGNSTC
jgi:rhodanese-related sulfurtransferase